MTHLPDISVIVPCYNSELTIPDLVSRIELTLSTAGMSFDIVLVEDHSSDRTWEVICELARRRPGVRGFRLMRNYGQHNALLCGIRRARAGIIVTIDDDLQNPPEEIPRLLSKLDEGYDVVYGTPQRQRHGFLRNAASRITKLALQGTMGASTAGSVSAFRAFRTSLRGAFDQYRGAFVFIDVLLTWGGCRFAAVEVKHDPRTLGRSNYTFQKLVVHALNMTTGFSTAPLKLASLVGFFFTLLGGVMLLYVLINFVVYGSLVHGFAFLASTIIILSGAQLFALGIVGEYLARIHVRTMDRPPYAVLCSTEPDEAAILGVAAGPDGSDR
jgi:undecaprenyl-phosphate 4-deoxy-4-formamido-L-arabinose transferase